MIADDFYYRQIWSSLMAANQTCLLTFKKMVPFGAGTNLQAAL